MARNYPITKPDVGRVLGIGEQFKFRSPLSVEPHTHKIV